MDGLPGSGIDRHLLITYPSIQNTLCTDTLSVRIKQRNRQLPSANCNRDVELLRDTRAEVFLDLPWNAALHGDPDAAEHPKICCT